MSFNILFLKLFSIILIFLAFNFTHKTVFVQNYFFITSTNYNYIEEFPTQKKILSFLTRTLFIICASLILSYIFDYKIIYLGALVSTFLIIWPPIVYLNLLKFPFTTKKIIILFRYFLYMLNTYLLVYFSDNFLKKSLQGENIYILDNSAVALIINLFFLSFPTILDKIISKLYYSNYNMSINIFEEEVRLTIEKISFIQYYLLSLYKFEILKFSKKNNINPCLIFYLLCIENLNRGGKIYRKLEKIYCCFFYERAIKKDISVGISQIKISNIVNILRQSPIMFKKNLFKPSFSINVMTLIIKKIFNEYDDCSDYFNGDIFSYIASNYNGNYEIIDVKIYSAVLRSLMKNKTLKYKKINYDEEFYVY